MLTFIRRVALTCLIACVVPASAWATSASAPRVVGSVSNNSTLAGPLSVAVAGNDAFTTTYWPGQLTAVDISAPTSPAVVGSTAPMASLKNGTNVTVAGNFAFVVSKNRNASTSNNDDGSGNSLTVVNISNPASPAVVGSVHSSSQLFGSYGIAVSGHYAFVAYQGVLSGQPSAPDTSTGGFSVIDLSNLSAGVVANIDNGALPAPYTGQNVLQHATSVAISGSYAVVTAFYSSRLTVVNIANPTSPQIVASLHDTANMAFPVDVAVQGPDAYVADQVGGSSPQLTVVDIANPASPAVVGTLSASATLNNAYRIRARGSFAYLAAKNANAVSAIDVSNPARPRLAGFVQDPGHLYSTSGLDLDASGRYVIANSPELSSESGFNITYPPFSPTTGTLSVIDLIPNPIGVAIAPSSEPPNPTTQKSASFGFAATDDVSTVACSLDGAPPGACTSPTTQTFPSLSIGSHTFSVTATDAAGHASSTSYTWTIGTPPARTGTAPSIAGSALVGHVLRGTPGSWSGTPAPSFAYRWERCRANGGGCSAIPGATATTYTVSKADIGHALLVSVRATNGLGSAVAGSRATGAVPPAATASLNGIAAGKPRVRVDVDAGPRGAVLTQITLTLPSGLRFASGQALQRAITVRNARGHRLAISASLRKGALVIRLRAPQRQVSITVTSGGLHASSALRTKARRHRGTRVGLGVAIKDRGGHVSHQTLRPGLS